MANFSQIDENNIVVNVLVVPDEEEHRGQEFLNELGIEGRWIQTSINTRGGIHYDPETGNPSKNQEKALRKNFGGIGYYYDEKLDVFIPPKSEEFPSFILDNETALWVPPVPKPKPVEGSTWAWAELEQQWFLIPNSEMV